MIFLLANPAMPNNAVPNSQTPAGNGTTDIDGVFTAEMNSSSSKPMVKVLKASAKPLNDPADNSAKMPKFSPATTLKVKVSNTTGSDPRFMRFEKFNPGLSDDCPFR